METGTAGHRPCRLHHRGCHQADRPADGGRVPSRFGANENRPWGSQGLVCAARSGVDNPRRPTDLFQSLLVSSGAVTRQVDRLERQGFVERLPDPAYQRGSLIRLTRRGIKGANAAIEAICSDQTTIGAAISSLSEDDRKIGRRFLTRLLAKFEEANGFGSSGRTEEFVHGDLPRSEAGSRKERV